MDDAQSRRLRVVVAGAGVAAVELGLALRHLAADLVELTLVAPDDQFAFKPAAVGEPFGVATVRRFDIHRVVADLDATLVSGSVIGVAPDERRVEIRGYGQLEYDALVVATGAVAVEAVPGAVTFAGPNDAASVRRLIDRVAGVADAHLLFAIPANIAWTLPVYELALLASTYLAKSGTRPRIQIVSPEPTPLAAFGEAASHEVQALLTEREIRFHGMRTPLSFTGGALRTSPAGVIAAHGVISLPRLRGPHLPGLPSNAEGFLATDELGRVRGLTDVYAAGDATAFPIKQGGIAAQQADAAASAIAADAGAETAPEPFHPVLRGLLVTGDQELYLRAEVTGGAGPTSTATTKALWWPPIKIPGRHLGPYLARLAADTEVHEPRDTT